MDVGVEDAVGVFVEDDGLVEVAERIESDEGVLSLPALKEFAGDFVALLPEDGREGVEAGLAHSDDEQGCAGFQREVVVAAGKDCTHLLELLGDIAAIFFGAVGNYLEVRALNLAPRLSGGRRGMQERKTSSDAGRQEALKDVTFEHQSIVGRGMGLVKENFGTARKHVAAGARATWQRR